MRRIAFGQGDDDGFDHGQRILLANSRVGRKDAGNVRQTSVCRWLPPLVHCRKPRQTSVCRTFLDSPTVSQRGDIASGEGLIRDGVMMDDQGVARPEDVNIRVPKTGYKS